MYVEGAASGLLRDFILFELVCFHWCCLLGHIICSLLNLVVPLARPAKYLTLLRHTAIPTGHKCMALADLIQACFRCFLSTLVVFAGSCCYKEKPLGRRWHTSSFLLGLGLVTCKSYFQFTFTTRACDLRLFTSTFPCTKVLVVWLFRKQNHHL